MVLVISLEATSNGGGRDGDGSTNIVHYIFLY